MSLSSLIKTHGFDLFVFISIISIAVPVISSILLILTYYIQVRIIGIRKNKIKGRHILITGGSTGLGKSVAIELLKSGAKSVAIVARGSKQNSGKTSLDETIKELEDIVKNKNLDCDIKSLKLDVSNYEECKRILSKFVIDNKIDWLILNAGMSIPQLIFDSDTDNEHKMMNVNYFGSLNVVTTLNLERIIFVGSLVCYGGFSGFSGYASSKYALRGLADSLRNELFSFGTKVHIWLPGSMDTIGFEEENKVKPEVTKNIEGNVIIESPDLAAKTMLAATTLEYYSLTNDVISDLAQATYSGLTPRSRFILQVLSSPFILILSELFVFLFDREAKNYFSSNKV